MKLLNTITPINHILIIKYLITIIKVHNLKIWDFKIAELNSNLKCSLNNNIIVSTTVKRVISFKDLCQFKTKIDQQHHKV